MNRAIKHTLLTVAILLIMASATKSSYAQHYIGARVGYGSGSSRFYPEEDMKSIWGLYSGGVAWKYYSKERALGGIEIDILFMQRGFKRAGKGVAAEFNGNISDTTGVYERRINSIVIPIFWQPHVYLFKRQMRIFLNLGATLSYNLNSKYKVTTKDPFTPGGVIIEGRHKMLLTRDNRFGYGLSFGGGVSWAVRSFEIFTEVRYYLGYGDILKNTSKYEANPRRSPLDGIQLSMGFFLKVGGGDVLDGIGKRGRRKLEEREEKMIKKEAEQERVNGEEEGVKSDTKLSKKEKKEVERAKKEEKGAEVETDQEIELAGELNGDQERTIGQPEQEGRVKEIELAEELNGNQERTIGQPEQEGRVKEIELAGELNGDQERTIGQPEQEGGVKEIENGTEADKPTEESGIEEAEREIKQEIDKNVGGIDEHTRE